MIDSNWTRFIKTGKVEDYLKYVNSCKEQEIIGGNTADFYNTRLSDKGTECRGERPTHNNLD